MTGEIGGLEKMNTKNSYHPMERDEGVLRVTTLIDDPSLDRSSTSLVV